MPRRAKPVTAPLPISEDDADLPELIHPESRAHELSLRGLTWREVAERTGYASAGAAQNAVTRWLGYGAALRTADEQRHAFDSQVERYGSLLNAWWDKARTDVTALTGVLRILERMDRLYRLDEPQAATTRTTLVVPADPEGYLATLQQIVDARAPRVIEGAAGEQTVVTTAHKKRRRKRDTSSVEPSQAPESGA